MSIASLISVDMSDKDKEWIENIFPIKNLQPTSPGFDSGISGVSLDSSDHQIMEQRLDGVEMDYLHKNPFSEEFEEPTVGTEKDDVSVADGNNSLYLEFDKLVGSPPETDDPYRVSGLSNYSSNLLSYGDAASDDFIDMFKSLDQPTTATPTASSSFTFDCGEGQFSFSNSKSRNFSTTTTTSTDLTQDQRFNNNNKNASTSSTGATSINHFGFSKNNANIKIKKEHLITPKSQSFPEEEEEEKNNMKNNKEEDLDDTKKTKRLLRNKKNAEMARANRQKKKNHVQNLEGKVKELTEYNTKLEEENAQLSSSMELKNREIDYLKNILTNHSALSQVLEYIPVKKKIHLSSEFRPEWTSFSTQNCDLKDKYTNHNDSGICLHFKPDNHISLEFCVKCSQSSRMTCPNQEQLYKNGEFSNS